MPAKAHRTSSGLTRTHSRTSSGGTSKVNLNLHLTQKDSVAPRYPDKQSKRNGHVYHETNGRSSPFLRNNSSIRVQSKEHIQAPALRRAPTQLTSSNNTSSSKPKVGFTIASPPEGDDDEWVSSESGAATPCQSQDADADQATSPIEQAKPSAARTSTHLNGFAKDEMPTPRATTPPLPRVDTARPSQPLSPAPPPRGDATQSQQSTQPLQSPQQLVSLAPKLQQLPQAIPLSPVPKARSETHSPPRRSPDHNMKRQSMTRPPSTHSITSRTESGLRPHPLIRAHSYGQGLLGPAKPAPLAPLTTVIDEVTPAHLSTSTSPTSLRAVSPSMSIKTSSASPVLSQGSSTSSEAHRQLRRTSTSSTRSTATMPVISSASASQLQFGRTNHDRQRTLSSSSTFAALSSLAMRSTPSPPRTPVHQFRVTFPAVDQNNPHQESIHPLLPPPYLNAHLTMLTYRNPLAESYDRVIRAKQAL